MCVSLTSVHMALSSSTSQQLSAVRTSKAVRVRAIEATTTASRWRTLSLRLEAVDPPGDAFAMSRSTGRPTKILG